MNFWRRGKLWFAGALGLDLTHTQAHYAKVLQELVPSGVSWLEVGCGRQIIPAWALDLDAQRQLAARPSMLVGIDVDPAIGEHPLIRNRVIGLGGSFPFRAGSFQLVTANMVVEHVEDPLAFLRDVNRILTPGGVFLFHTVNYRYYLIWIAARIPDAIKKKIIFFLERRHETDVFPTYYRMNCASQIMTLAGECGFETVMLKTNGSNGSFGRLGPLGWLECVILKLAASLGGGKYNSNLVVVYRKLAAP